MTLERAIALIFVVVCVAYGYTAFVVMEASLLPFERNMTFLPNVLPKWLSIIGALVGSRRAGAVGFRQPAARPPTTTSTSATYVNTSSARQSCCWRS